MVTHNMSIFNPARPSRWFTALFVVVLGILTSACSQGKKTKQDKPNILWITIEDTSPQFIGCYGNKIARTPHIDNLATEGIRFMNAFSTGTVCSPSRTCIITGLKTYTAGTGNHRSKYPVPDYVKGFPYYLQKAGYYTSNNHKTDYNIANEQAFINEAWNESSKNAGWEKRQPGQPFFAVFNFLESHQSRTMTKPYSWYEKNVLAHLDQHERIAEKEFEMPPFYNDSPDMRKQFARVYNAISLTDKRIGMLLSRLEEDQLTDSTIIFFFADHGEGMPRGKTNGINYGYRVPFIVWFPEIYKHLSPWGTGGAVTDELISFEDLAPTLISLAGGKVPDHMKGRKLIGPDRSTPTDHLILSSDRSDNGIDVVRTVTDGTYIYSRNFMPFMPECRYIRYMEIGKIKQLMRSDLADNVLNSLQTSILQERPPEFLYNIEKDLWETNNLAGNADYQVVLNKMRKQLETEILQSRDVMLLPEYEIARLSKQTTAYEYRSDEENFPLSKIYAAASLSGFRGSETTEKQIQRLKSSNMIVRYWAATGLRSQNNHDLLPYTDQINEAMSDPYPPVAITASAIAYQLTGDQNAMMNLKEMCASDNLEMALMAINYLLYIDKKEPFTETIKSVYLMKDRSYKVKAACEVFLTW